MFPGFGTTGISLSQTFRNAVIVTRHPGFKFLWIDSLCIVQDSKDDWEKSRSNASGVVMLESRIDNVLELCDQKRKEKKKKIFAA